MSKQDDPILLNKYRLGRLLSLGTFAKVHLAFFLSSDSPFAIRILEKRHLLASATSTTVLREVSSMRRLSHPNILTLHELLATKSKIFLVTDFAAGGDLLSLLRRRRSRRIPEPKARRYFHQLASALHHCHVNGVAHRDVKPQNILIDAAGDLKLFDFGLSAFLDGRPLRTACGTPAYAAPEVLRRSSYDGTKADAWSLGVVMYRVLVGSLPFLEGSICSLYRRILRRDYVFPPWVSPVGRSVIDRLLDLNPERRMGVGELVGHPWLRGLGVEGERRVVGRGVSVGLGMNAFGIIGMASGLDLSGLFVEGRRRVRRFTTREKAGRIVGELVGRRKEGGFARGRSGLVVVSVEVVEVATSIVLVEVEVEEGGEGERLCWEELKGEIWDDHNEGV